MSFRYIIERKNAPAQLEKEVRTEGYECPERKLLQAFVSYAVIVEIWGRLKAYDWYDFVLDGLCEWDYVEETGEVELGGYVLVWLRVVQMKEGAAHG